MTWCDVASPADQAGIRTSRHLDHNFNAAHRPLSEFFVFPPTHTIHMKSSEYFALFRVGTLGRMKSSSEYFALFRVGTLGRGLF